MKARDHRRARIVAAAGSIAAAGGYDALTMRAVAARADLSTATLYRYFPSKHVLLVSILDRWLERFEIRAAMESGVPADPFDRLWSVVDCLYASLHRSPLLAEAMARAYAVAETTPAQAAPAQACQHIRTRLTDLFAAALGDEASGHHEAAAALLSDVWSANVLAMVHNRISPAELRRRLAITVRLLAQHPVTAPATAVSASPGTPVAPRPRPW